MHSMEYDPDNSDAILRATLSAHVPIGIGFDLGDELHVPGKRGRKKKLQDDAMDFDAFEEDDDVD